MFCTRRPFLSAIISDCAAIVGAGTYRFSFCSFQNPRLSSRNILFQITFQGLMSHERFDIQGVPSAVGTTGSKIELSVQSETFWNSR